MSNARSDAGTRYEALLTLALARATRLAIQAERRTALRKLDEGRLTLRLLEHQVGESQLKLCEADQQVGDMLNSLRSQGINTEEQLTEPFHVQELIDSGLYDWGDDSSSPVSEDDDLASEDGEKAVTQPSSPLPPVLKCGATEGLSTNSASQPASSIQPSPSAPQAHPISSAPLTPKLSATTASCSATRPDRKEAGSGKRFSHGRDFAAGLHPATAELVC